MPSRRQTLALLSTAVVPLSGCLGALDGTSVTPRLYAVDVTNETAEPQSVTLRVRAGDETVFETTATVQADIRQQFAIPMDEPESYAVELRVESRAETRTVTLSKYATADTPCVHPVFEIYGSAGLVTDVRAYTDCTDRPTTTA